MRQCGHAAALVGSILLAASGVQAAQTVRLATDPALSPDGSTLVFSWRDDIWSVPSSGGEAVQLTRHPARDRQPKFSPDAKQIAFTSDREGSYQVYVMDAAGGAPEQLTYHTEGYTLSGWFPNGRSLLVNIDRDHFWRHEERFARIQRNRRAAERVLFDAYGEDGSLSPDGRKLLFVREGVEWWRKGYIGSRAGQIWMYDLRAREFEKVLDDERGSQWPMWRPDGNAFYYVSGVSGSLNLWIRDLESGDDRQLTEFEDDSVVFPCISTDGSVIVFRHLFDFYRYEPGKGELPQPIEIVVTGDDPDRKIERRVLSRATDVAFTDDGLEIAFISGGDLWVMDTELREPVRITETPQEERNPVFSPNGESIVYVSDAEGQSDIWRATRGDEKQYWWRNTKFNTEPLTEDAEVETDLRFSPDRKHLAYIKGLGDLWLFDPETKDGRRLIRSWNTPQYDFSPDGKWIVYALSDADFNRDIWLLPVDGSREAFNLSRHPDNEYDPVWSPDGRIIAFTGRRVDTEVDIHYVWLRAEDDEKDSRQRRLEKALEAMKKARSKKSSGKSSLKQSAKSKSDDAKGGDEADDEKDAKKPDAESEKKAAEPDLPKVVIDFDRIHERIRRVPIPDSSENELVFSPDSKKLAFVTTINGQRGTYTIEFPDELRPKLLSSRSGNPTRWLKEGNKIVWLSDGVPGSVSASGSVSSYAFRARQEVNREARNRAAFDLAWRTMRDNWYDESMNNRNWDEIRRKYIDAAAEAPDAATLATVVNLMLGELNGSHLGFSARPFDSSPPADQWRDTTAHLGVRFERGYRGPGLKVRDVLPEGPADRAESRIQAGEIILSIDGLTVDPAMDLTQVLNGPLERDIRLRVRNDQDEQRTVTLRPISYGAARNLLYEKWVEDNRSVVDRLSKGRLGYMHIRGMNMSSFWRFEAELYSVGAGKDGIVIDVRENGGGSTTDHLLTVLTQPVHAITVPRGGEPGYPQDRKVYASWHKPIVVLCNQNSFSNAEIFSHAIKTLERGKLVGTPTAGGVISTGSRSIMDVGYIRVPFRGWYLLDDGQDMELNGAVPDYVIWPQPGDWPAGRDGQLRKAVTVLQEEVEAYLSRPRPSLRKASQRTE